MLGVLILNVLSLIGEVFFQLDWYLKPVFATLWVVTLVRHTTSVCVSPPLRLLWG